MAELSWRDAIMQILKDADEPTHYSDIAQAVIDRELRTVGATPANSVSATISLSIKNEGLASPFVRTEHGMYAMREIASANPVPEVHDEAQEDAEQMGLINAFGMFWRRDRVNWSPAEPALLGQQQAGSDEIDFATQAGVYILYNGERVIYVGRVTATRLGRRLREHTRDRLNGRWDQFSWFGVRALLEKGTLQDTPNNFSIDNLVATMEALLIEGLEPPQNRRQGDFNAVEFIQVVDPEIARQAQKRLLEKMQSSI